MSLGITSKIWIWLQQRQYNEECDEVSPLFVTYTKLPHVIYNTFCRNQFGPTASYILLEYALSLARRFRAYCIKVFKRPLLSSHMNVKQSDTLHRKQLFTYVKHNFTLVCTCMQKLVSFICTSSRQDFNTHTFAIVTSWKRQTRLVTCTAFWTLSFFRRQDHPST
jgi:hypothetical protein